MDINQKINKIAIEYFNDNNVRFARELGTSEANIRNYRTKIVPKVDFLVNLHKSLAINFDWLFLDKGPMIKKPIEESLVLNEPIEKYLRRTDTLKDSQVIPLYDITAAAGLTSLFEGNQNVIDYISIPNMPSCDGAIPVTGDSMYPLLKSGDIALYKIMHDFNEGIIWGEMYLLSVKIGGDDYTLVKYIQRSDKGEDWIKLVSQNQHHSPKDVRLVNLRALALVKGVIRYNVMA